MKQIEVLIADDHAIIRDALKMIISDADDLVVAGEAACGKEVLDLVRAQNWGLIVLDLMMPGRSGIELTKLIHAERPGLPILVFSMYAEKQYAIRAMRAGASGYLSKGGDINLLLPTMRKVAAGGVYVSAEVAELLAMDTTRPGQAPPHTLLSNREYEIFNLIIRGFSLTIIAEELSLSVKTVSTHKSHILAKLNVSNQMDLLRYAIAHDLLPDVLQ